MDFGAHCSGKWWNTGVQQTLGYWGMRVQRVSGAWGPHLIAVVRIQFLLLWSEFTVLTPLVRILLLFSALLAENWCNQICSEDGKGKI